MGQIGSEALRQGHGPWLKMACAARASRCVVTSCTAHAVARPAAVCQWMEGDKVFQ
jgi:hypothetical protein